ncbi:MAG: ATP-binding protein, partial [candidate division KSB1 bacterium]|nr:ATP-binding protein [candidate division KSB1 bacterium]
DPRTLESFLFRPGFSTRGTADALAGRGVGMDVVASAVEKFNGRLGIRSVTGRGTTVEVLLPLESSGGL